MKEKMKKYPHLANQLYHVYQKQLKIDKQNPMTLQQLNKEALEHVRSGSDDVKMTDPDDKSQEQEEKDISDISSFLNELMERCSNRDNLIDYVLLVNLIPGLFMEKRVDLA